MGPLDPCGQRWHQADKILPDQLLQSRADGSDREKHAAHIHAVHHGANLTPATVEKMIRSVHNNHNSRRADFPSTICTISWPFRISVSHPSLGEISFSRPPRPPNTRILTRQHDGDIGHNLHSIDPPLPSEHESTGDSCRQKTKGR